MNCRKCGAPLADGVSVCHACHTKVGEGHNFCPECGQEMEPTASFCPSCGTKVEPMATKGKVDSDYVEPERPAPRAAAGQSGGSAASRLRGNGGSSAPKTGTAAERLRGGGSGSGAAPRGSAAERLRGGGSAASRLRGGSGSYSSGTSGGSVGTPSYSYRGSSSGASELGGKNKAVAILLCFFLGGIGVHNFYMGETKKGIARVLLSIFLYGVGGIVAFIDFIRLIIGNYNYNPNKWF